MALLEDKTAVVTGGSSGIGRAICLQFARHGADVIVADVRKKPRDGEQPTHELLTDRFEQSAEFVECDVTDIDNLAVAIKAAGKWGGIDVMVNNAGIDRQEDVFDINPEEFEEILSVNLFGSFFGTKLAAMEMMENETSGSVINLSSTSGLVGSMTSTSYSASKGGVTLMTYSFAALLGPHDIRVNTIHPGTIETSMTVRDLGTLDPATPTDDDSYSKIPLRRVGQPTEVANAAVFLASELSSYVTAESLVVDGGRLNTV